MVIIGGSNIDYHARSNNKIIYEDSNLGELSVSFGGVARNISENLARLGIKHTFISGIGNDRNGRILKEELENLGVRVYSPKTNYNTSTYLAVSDSDGKLVVGINDMKIIEEINIDYLKSISNIIENEEYIYIDGNLDNETIDYVFNTYKNKKIISDGISKTKVKKLLNHLDELFLLQVNSFEYKEIINKGTPKHLIVTNGKNPINYYHDSMAEIIEVESIEKIADETGAGDSMLAATIYGILNNYKMIDAIKLGIKASRKTIMSKDAVDKDINTILKD